MSFWDEVSDDESEFDPYNKFNTTRYHKCKYGAYIGLYEDNYCCHKCMLEKKKHQEEIKYKTFYYIFYNEETRYPINNDWSVLGLKPPKTQTEIKKRYRKLCLKAHPDKGGSKEHFINITNSYNNLCLIS
jgi:hypothetical protein